MYAFMQPCKAPYAAGGPRRGLKYANAAGAFKRVGQKKTGCCPMAHFPCCGAHLHCRVSPKNGSWVLQFRKESSMQCMTLRSPGPLTTVCREQSLRGVPLFLQ